MSTGYPAGTRTMPRLRLSVTSVQQNEGGSSGRR